MDIKNYLISNQLVVKYPHRSSFIFTWHRNSNTVLADDVLYIWSNSIFLTKIIKYASFHYPLKITVPLTYFSNPVSLLLL